MFALAVIGGMALLLVACGVGWFALTTAIGFFAPRDFAARAHMRAELQRLGINVKEIDPAFVAGLARAADIMSLTGKGDDRAALVHEVQFIARLAVRCTAGLGAAHENQLWMTILKLGFPNGVP